MFRVRWHDFKDNAERYHAIVFLAPHGDKPILRIDCDSHKQLEHVRRWAWRKNGLIPLEDWQYSTVVKNSKYLIEVYKISRTQAESA